MNTIIRLLCDGDGSTQKRFAIDGLMALGETVTLQFEGLPENMAGKPVKMAAWLQESNECIWIAEGALSLKKAETKAKNAKPIYTMNVTAPASQEAIAAFQQTDAPFIGIALTAIVGTADLGFALTRLYRGSNWREVIPADLDKPTWYTDLKAMYETVVDAKTAVIKLEENVVDKHGEVVQMHEDVVTKHDDMMPKYDDFVVKHEEIYELKAATDENAAATAADVVSIAGAAEIAIFSANIAAAAREEAKTSATNANASATSASASASNASTSATTATTAKNEAVQARDEAQQLLSTKQDKLIAGENIAIAADGKTISATGGADITVDEEISSESANPVQNKAIKTALDAKQDKLVAGDAITIAEDGKTIDVTPNAFVKLGAMNDMGGDVNAAIRLINRNYGGNDHYPLFRLNSQARTDRWFSDIFFDAVEFTGKPGEKIRLAFERGNQDAIVRKEEMDAAIGDINSILETL